MSGEKDKEFKSLDGCGRKGAGSIRIVGGSQIRKHEYPWLCSLRRRGGHICGITLLSVYPKETILVGAAHCYNKESKRLSLYSITNVSNFPRPLFLQTELVSFHSLLNFVCTKVRIKVTIPSYAGSMNLTRKRVIKLN